jgi:hypothetical protein
MSSSNVSSTSGWLLISGILALTIVIAVVLYFVTKKRPGLNTPAAPGPNVSAPSPTNVNSGGGGPRPNLGAPPRTNL